MTALDKGGDRIAALLTRRSAERFWSDRYIQHSAHIAPGRAGLFDLIRTQPETLRYENHLIMAEGDYVIAHGRFSGNGRPAAWIAADVIRFEDGKLAEHWDVLQDDHLSHRRAGRGSLRSSAASRPRTTSDAGASSPPRTRAPPRPPPSTALPAISALG